MTLADTIKFGTVLGYELNFEGDEFNYPEGVRFEFSPTIPQLFFPNENTIVNLEKTIGHLTADGSLIDADGDQLRLIANVGQVETDQVWYWKVKRLVPYGSYYKLDVTADTISYLIDWQPIPSATPLSEVARGRQGIQGIQGIQGLQGLQGVPGPGVPAGGAGLAVLRKTNSSDFVTEWRILTPADVGADPAGTAATAIALEVLDRNTAIASRIASLVNSAPGLLDTLAEIANALGNDPNFATTILAAIANAQSNAQTNAATYTDSKITAEVSRANGAYDAAGAATGAQNAAQTYTNTKTTSTRRLALVYGAAL